MVFPFQIEREARRVHREDRLTTGLAGVGAVLPRGNVATLRECV